MVRKTKIKIQKHNKVGVPTDKIEFSEGQYVTFFSGKRDHYLKVESIRINPMNQKVEYVLIHRPEDNRFSVTATPEQIKQSKYFTG